MAGALPGPSPGFNGPPPVFEPEDPYLAALRAEVGARCAAGQPDQELLPSLVSDLYLSGVDPADAAEALMLGNCGPPASIVRELVAQGGGEAVAPVVTRALLLVGPDRRAIIESAASSGLELNGDELRPRPEGGGDDSHSYAMAYFPSRAAVMGLETAGAVDTLYTEAAPGYGIYTFVVLGASAREEKDRARTTELLRVIESYVLAEQGIRDPSPEVHSFLVPVHPQRGKAPLADQTDPDLSEPVRRALAGYLRRQGQDALAERLESGPGPFLVSSPEPRLIPTSSESPWLITDLSTVGSAYLYAVVDAFDRPIPPEPSERQEGLAQIRQRLIELFPRPGSGPAQHSSAEDWVFPLGRGSGTASAGGLSEPPPAARGGGAWHTPSVGTAPPEETGSPPAGVTRS